VLCSAGFKLDMSIKTVGTPQARGLGLMAYVKATTGWEDSEGLCPITANVNDGYAWCAGRASVCRHLMMRDD